MDKVSQRKVKGGKFVKVKVSSDGGYITDVKITGDFFAHPEDAFEQVEKELKGMPVDRVRATVESALGGIVLVGLSKEDLIEMIEECLE